MYFLNDICFLCLIRNKSIKNVLLQDDDGIVVEEKLKYVLYAEFSYFKPDVPKNICIDCLKNINYFYIFKQKCIKSMIDLSKYIENQTVENNKYNFVSTSNTEQHDTELSSNIKSENIEQYSFCEAQTEKNSEEPKVEIKIEQEEIHEASSQHYTSFDEEYTETFPENVIIKEEYVGEQPFIEDIQINDDSNHELNITENIEVTSAQKQRRKRRSKKQPPRSYTCNECHKSFPFLSLLEMHTRVHTGARPFKCAICFKAFSQKAYLTQHVLIHNSVRSYKCTLCDKAFKQRFLLNRHMNTHTNIKPYECEVCHRTFNKHCNLKDHKRIHENIRPYKCEVCSKTFITNNSLTVHMRSHTKDNPYKCEVCSKAFSTSSGLKVHVRLHTGDRPYPCHICPRKFTASNQLKRHVRTHSNETLYCHLCSYDTTSNGNFKRHMKKHDVNVDTADGSVE